ncbi:unnamed protein product [Cuscuta campestris]|uniref:3'-5' exonuclease domain-containing protein n=1 Tax=Cuscuta campestris TaxID=132261 RepID=A0A484M8F1_9ASTE|nr:unnamed protein product [Cuscuta campestris]
MFNYYGRNRWTSSSSPSSITFNSSNSKYYVQFGGRRIETTVTDRAAVANEWVAHVRLKHASRGEPTVVVGLDNEWRPHPVRYMSNKSATLQLCIDEDCLILQLFHMERVPEELKEFLADPTFVFVGVEVADDVRKLREEYGLVCARSEDIRELAKRKWPGRFSRPGLKDLASEVCGLHMPKPKHVCMSNWEVRELSSTQVEYGCIDAYASYKIGHLLILENN